MMADPHTRAVGEASLHVRERFGKAAVARAYRSGAAQLRFAAGRPDEVDALVINTAGGLTSGDTFALEVAVEGGALTLATPACERIYRCEAGPATITQTVRVADGTHLRQLPQPTIVYAGAHLIRRTAVHLDGSAALTLCESLVLGREAMGEDALSATIADRVDVWRDGRLVLVDALRLGAGNAALRQSASGLGGARGIALMVSTRTERLDAVRAAAEPAGRASVVNGLLVARSLASSHSQLQDGLCAMIEAASGSGPPRAWAL